MMERERNAQAEKKVIIHKTVTEVYNEYCEFGTTGKAYSRNYVGAEQYDKLCKNKDTKIHMPKMKVDKEGLEYIDLLINKGVKIHILNMGLIVTNLLAFAEFK